MGDVTKAASGAALGALLAWTAHSFTIDGELKALTRSVERIEHRLDRLSQSQIQAEPKARP